MATIQPALHVPEEIAAGVMAGLYVIDGGTVRDLAGRIVKLLKEAPGASSTQQGVLSGIAKALTNRKATTIGLGAAALVIAGGTAFLIVKNRKQLTKSEVPKSVENYNASLGAYLEAASNGRLDVRTIDQLISDLDAAVEESGNGRTIIDVSTEQFEALVKLLADYTRELAEVNQIELGDLQESTPHPEGSDSSLAIIDLRRHLAIQKQIFDKTA